MLPPTARPAPPRAPGRRLNARTNVTTSPIVAPRRDGAGRRTQVELTWIEKKVERWLRFGRPAEETILDRRTRFAGFAPWVGSAFVRWASNDFGTVVSRIDVVPGAVAPGEPAHQTLPFVRPGGEILLHVSGWPKVERVLQAIDTVEALGVLIPSRPRLNSGLRLNNRLAAGFEPGAYTRNQHEAWSSRWRIGA